MSRLIVSLKTFVFFILFMGRVSKIASSIINSISIDMVNFGRQTRPFGDFIMHMNYDPYAIAARVSSRINGIPMLTDARVPLPLTEIFKITIIDKSNFTLS